MGEPRILLVEDEGLVALDIRKRLHALGYANVDTARNADKALSLAEQAAPDLALLDIKIDGPMDGIELGEELRRRCGTPVIYLTAFSDDETLNRAKRTEPYGFLVKPINQRELHSTVEVALYRHKLELERERAEAKVRELERQLIQTQKMDAIGQLTAGIAHELNNALLTVVGNINLARTSRQLEPEMEISLDAALDGCNRSAGLIKQLLGFARQGLYRPEQVSLWRALNDALSFLEPLLEQRVRCLTICENQNLQIVVDREQFQQMITNLAMNAKQAMPEGGVVQFKIMRSLVENPQIHNPQAKPGYFVTLQVKDQGAGIEPNLFEKIFEPFFSTKPVGEGTGLGLSVVYGIMQNHGGWVSVESEKDKGSVFTLHFPEAAALL